ncbi:hypothetical protein CU097_008401 [Rhizopus azygosporus]|uniref:Uncharacterized protein n=1 Tax=Rhizopus azygosporus TaxID=86630 RepID=A0A367K9V0_RHIAZ|nr:hypothetical protein CU097_008401 [Rhizopus azygosporus]
MNPMTESSNVIFLIDIQSFMKDNFTMDQLKMAMERIIFYYNIQLVSSSLFWSFAFFSSLTTLTDRMNIQLHSFNKLPELKDYLTEEYKRYPGYTAEASESQKPYERMKEAIRSVLQSLSWDNTASSQNRKSKNYIFAIMSLPNSLSSLNSFSLFQQPEQPGLMGSLHGAADIFLSIKKDFIDEFSANFEANRISFSIIDADVKFDRHKLKQKMFDNLLGRGFQLCLQKFGGRYVLFNSLIQDYNKFSSHYHQELEALLSPMNFQGPARTVKNRYIGHFLLYPFNTTHDTQSFRNLTPYSHVRMHPAISRSQFKVSWLTHSKDDELNSDLLLVPDTDNSHLDCFTEILQIIHSTGKIGIAELVPVDDTYTSPIIVAIIPYTRNTAVMRFLNISTVPAPKPILAVPSEPITCFMPSISSVSGEQIPNTSKSSIKKKVPLKLEPSEKLKHLMMMHIQKEEETKRSVDSNQMKQKPDDQNEEEELTINLPKTIPEFKRMLYDLYLETLFERTKVFELFIRIIHELIENIIKVRGFTHEEIIEAMRTVARDSDHIETRHAVDIMNGKQLEYSPSLSKEQRYLYEWWERVREISEEPRFDEKMLRLLRLTDFRLQTIIYCFMAKLAMTSPLSNSEKNKRLQRELTEHARSHFAITFSETSLLDVVSKIDDVIDEVDQFKDDLTDLMKHLREEYHDEWMEMYVDSVAKFVNLGVETKNETEKKPKKESKKRSLAEMLQKEKEEKEAKRKKPNTFEDMLKKSIEYSAENTRDHIGESTRMAIERVNRSMVNGKPTIKRAGGFLVSALSPRRPTTISRERQPIVDPNLTPRTSLSRFLGVDIYEQYAEYCEGVDKVKATLDQPNDNIRYYSSEPLRHHIVPLYYFVPYKAYFLSF